MMGGCCKECQSRYVGCHAECEKYITAKAKHDAECEEARKGLEADRYATYIRRQMSRIRSSYERARGEM